MAILGSIITGVFVASGLTRGIDDGLPIWISEKGYWPMEILYCLPRIVAPFFLLYSIILCKPLWGQLLVCVLLYLFSFSVKAIYRKVAYGINIFNP